MSTSNRVLMCLVANESPDRCFEIEIPSCAKVCKLKDAIKEKKQPFFDHIPADRLDLYQVPSTSEFPYSEATLKDKKLAPEQELPDPSPNSLFYIIVLEGKTESQRKDMSRWKHSALVVAIVFASLTSILVGVLLGWNLRVRDVSGGNLPPGPSFDGSIIYLDMALRDVNVIDQKLSVDWDILGDSMIERGACSCDNATNCLIVDLLLDPNVLKNPVAAPVPLTNSITVGFPTFRYNGSAMACFVEDPLTNTANFQTDLILQYPFHGTTSLQSYPFDRYYAELNMNGREVGSNATVAIILRETFGTVAGFYVKWHPARLVHSSNVDIVFHITRSTPVIIYDIIIVISLWVITLLFILSTVKVLFGYAQRIEALLMAPATLFAFTSLRATMPGAPTGFGSVIDFVALLPCLAILAFCTAFILAAVFVMDPTRNRVSVVDLTLEKMTKLVPHPLSLRNPPSTKEGSRENHNDA